MQLRQRLVYLGVLGVCLSAGMLVASEAKVAASDSKKIDEACHYLDEVPREDIVAWGVMGDTVFAGCSDGEIMTVRNREVRTLVERNNHSQDLYAGFGDSGAELLAIKVLDNGALIVALNTGLIEVFDAGKLMYSNEADVHQKREQDELNRLLSYYENASIAEQEDGGVIVVFDDGASEEVDSKTLKSKLEASLSRKPTLKKLIEKRLKRLYFM